MFRERPKVAEQDVRDKINKMGNSDLFITRNETPSTVLDAENATLKELSNVVATLIKNLKKQGILKDG